VGEGEGKGEGGGGDRWATSFSRAVHPKSASSRDTQTIPDSDRDKGQPVMCNVAVGTEAGQQRRRK